MENEISFHPLTWHERLHIFHFTFECLHTYVTKYMVILTCSKPEQSIQGIKASSLSRIWALISWQSLSIWRRYAYSKHSKRSAAVAKRHQHQSVYSILWRHIQMCWTWNEDMPEGGGSVGGVECVSRAGRQAATNVFSILMWCQVKAFRGSK